MCLPLLALIPAALSTVGGAGAAAGGLASSFAGGVGALAAGAAPTAAQSFALSTGLTAASAGSSFASQYAQAEASKQFAQQNALLAKQSYERTVGQTQLQVIQNRNQLDNQLTQQQREILQAQSRARVSSAEGGVSGVSIDGLLAEYDRRFAEANQATDYNLGVVKAQARENLLNARAGALGAINQGFSGVLPSPSILSPVLQTAGAGFQNYTNYLFPRTKG